MQRKFWTPAEIKTLKKLYPNTNSLCIANLLGKKINTVYSMANKLKLKKTDQYLATLNTNRILTESQRNSCFKKGNTPLNKGKKHADYMTPEQIEKTKVSQYKKGNVPLNTKYDGHERITIDGYVEIRISQGIYKLKHRELWIKANGLIPEDCIIIFKDGNKQNIVIENLQLITRKENMLRNSIQQYPAELITTLKLVSKLKKTIKQHEQH
jgi:hypothetical protein